MRMTHAMTAVANGVTHARHSRENEVMKCAGGDGVRLDVRVEIESDTALGVASFVPTLPAPHGHRIQSAIMVQPIPLDTLGSHSIHDGGTVTAITRIWAHGDAEQCALCPVAKCVAKRHHIDYCMIQVPKWVALADMAMFSLAGYEAEAALGARPVVDGGPTSLDGGIGPFAP